MKRTGPTNPNTQALIEVMHKADQPKVWHRIAEELSAARRNYVTLNVDQLSKKVKDGETVVVPTKILGQGVFQKKQVTVAALNYSTEARRKLDEAGCTVLTIAELMDQNPDGKNVRIIK